MFKDGRWCEGEKAIPLKKRRGNFENGILILENNNNATDHDHSSSGNSNGKKITKPRMKTKMNKKCSSMVQNGNNNMELREDGLEEAEEAKAEVVNIGSSNKKRTKGSAVMEGSRCSRVNGRGWRCCQQTLVGYSLCEHHLGKGRLRSMTSVRNRSIGATTTTTTTSTAPAPPKKKVHNNLDLSISVSGAASSSSSSSSSSLEKQMIRESGGLDDDPCLENNETKKAVVITTKKRMKLGMVKARSISSLLGQTNTTTPSLLL